METGDQIFASPVLRSVFSDNIQVQNNLNLKNDGHSNIRFNSSCQFFNRLKDLRDAQLNIICVRTGPILLFTHDYLWWLMQTLKGFRVLFILLIFQME